MCGLKDQAKPFVDAKLLQIDSVPQGAVVFISAPPRMINACYGGLMSTRAKHLGAVGTIIDGRLRDLQEHRDLDYPVFAKDVGTTAPQEVARVSEVGRASNISPTRKTYTATRSTHP